MEQTLNDMKKDVLMTVKGTQRVSGETDVTEMMTTIQKVEDSSGMVMRKKTRCGGVPSMRAA